MDLCKIFGVKEDEKFRLRPFQGTYVVHNNILYWKGNGSSLEPASITVNTLNNALVEKLPFEPDVGETYWTVHTDKWSVFKATWLDSPIDCMRKSSKMVFRTYEDAGFACPKIYEKLTGKNWEDYDGL